MKKHRAICTIDITQINHSKRRGLDISNEQYVICDVIAKCMAKVERVSKVILKEMLEDYVKEIDIIPLVERGIVEIFKIPQLGDSEFVRVTDKWGLGSDKEFELLWEMWSRVGNKKQSLIMYFKVRNSGIDHKYLTDKAKEYLSYIATSGTYQMHLSSWLNPQFEKFNDEYKSQRKDGQQETKIESGATEPGKLAHR